MTTDALAPEPPAGKRHPITSAESQAYIDTGEWPDATLPAWTTLTFRCCSCKRLTFASREAIDIIRNESYDPTDTDEDIVGGMDYCLGCINGQSPAGEYADENDTRTEAEQAPWRLTGLTATDVRNIEAAMEVAYEDGDHGMTDVETTLAKVKALGDDLRSVGALPAREG